MLRPARSGRRQGATGMSEEPRRTEASAIGEPDRGICFVICPIDDEGTAVRKRSDDVFNLVIRPAAAELGYGAERAIEGARPGWITERIIRRLLDAPMVVADLTDQNANVFYELAVRHSTRKPFVQIMQRGEQMPFDVVGLDTIFYEYDDWSSAVQVRERLVKQMRIAEAESASVRTPLSIAGDLQSLEATSQPVESLLRDIMAAQVAVSRRLDELADAATSSMPTPSLSVGQRRVLFSFIPGTPAEEQSTFLDLGTALVNDNQARMAYLAHRMIYSFPIPPEVTGADLIVDAWGSFVLAVARDAGDEPGEFQEELNALTLLGRIDYEGRTRGKYALDLTPYLEDNPARTIYVAIYAADQTTGWGAALWGQVQVATLDADEEKRMTRIRREADYRMKEERARCLLHLRTNSTDADAPYLYQDRGSEMQPCGRVVNGAAEVIYRIALKPEYSGSRLQVWVLGDFLVSYAADERGRPGEFIDALRARDRYDQRTIEEHIGVSAVAIDIIKATLDSGAVYVRIRNGAPNSPRGTQIHALNITRGP